MMEVEAVRGCLFGKDQNLIDIMDKDKSYHLDCTETHL
jgi:hypothetical protein